MLVIIVLVLIFKVTHGIQSSIELIGQFSSGSNNCSFPTIKGTPSTRESASYDSDPPKDASEIAEYMLPKIQRVIENMDSTFFLKSSKSESRFLSYVKLFTIKFNCDSQDIVNIVREIESLECIKFVELDTSTPILIDTSTPVEAQGKAMLFSRSGPSQFDDSLERYVPNDPLFPQQWGINATNVDAVWTHWRGGMNIGIADTGCDIGHEDLVGQAWVNEKEICNNGIDDDNNGYIDDCYGYNFDKIEPDLTDPIESNHGTAMTGLSSATQDNGLGISGICPKCKFMTGKLGDVGLSTGAFAKFFDYLLSYNVKVVNYSAGGIENETQNAAIRAARERGTILVTIAGNSGCDIDDETNECHLTAYPGRLLYDNIITVAASTTDEQNEFSYGATRVNVATPSMVMSALPGGGYNVASGTSAASAFTSGIVALVWSKWPDTPYLKIIEALTSSCRVLPQFKGKNICGGITDAYAFYNAVKAMQ